MKFLLVTLMAAAASAAFAPLNTAKERIDGSYIVVLNDGESLTAAVNTLRDSPFFSLLGGRIDRVYGSVLNGFSATLGEKALEFIRSMDIVKYVQEDGIVRASVASWGLDRIDQRDLPLDNTYTAPRSGAGVSVYVIDTGIRSTHEEFAGRVGQSANFALGSSAEDCNGHGSHCAGTVGGATYGVANGVTLHGIRVLGCLGSGSNSGVIGGVNHVAEQCVGKTCVASMSLGGGASTALDDAVNNLVNGGVPTAVAAGNDNANACNYSPARASSAITVGSTTSADRRSSFSNYGSCVNIFAPGSSITSAWHTDDTATNTISGTSMACPHVAGAAALLLDRDVSAGNVPSTMVNEATSGVVGNAGSGSPNLLLYVQ